MTYISFTSRHREVRLRGPEKAWARYICNDLLWLALNVNWLAPASDPIRRMLQPCYLDDVVAESRDFAQLLKTYLISSSDKHFTIKEQLVPIFEVALNTALVMGSDSVKLLARLNGQSEIHGYVEGPNRKWLGNIIVSGLRSGMMRAGMGWEDVVDLLNESQVGPVVTSFSVTDSFPNGTLPMRVGLWIPQMVDEDEEDFGLEWDWLPEDERWRLACQALRIINVTSRLELSPDDWQSFSFGHGINGFQVRAYADTLITSSST